MAVKIVYVKGGTIRHMATKFRRGLNVASTGLPSFVAGSNVRIKHRR